MSSRLWSNLTSPDWQCSSCRSVMRDAVQLTCGERMCEICALELGPFPSCPVCEEVLGKCSYDGYHYFFPDIYIRKKIEKNDPISCHQTICSWQGSISDYQAHYDEVHNMFGSTKTSEDGFQVDAVTNSSQCAEKFPVSLVVNGSLQQLHPHNAPANQLMSNSSRDQGLPRAVDGHDSYFFQEDIHNKSSAGYEVKEKARCAECRLWVFYDDLKAHREFCYKCHLYDGNCYRIANGPQEESGLQFGGELHLGNNDQADLLVRLVVNNLLGVVGDVHAVFNDLEGCLNRFQKQIKNEFSRRTPIEYPMIRSMLWKISNLSLRLRDFENPSILSSPFYSWVKGYKMRLRLDFHCTDLDNDAVLSLSLLIVEGENDKDLVWPFTREVTFGLLNFDKSNGIYKKLRPENLVTRCYSEDRGIIAVRYSWTLHQSERNGKIVRDDCLFIKCTV